jgi:hypothetical protein
MHTSAVHMRGLGTVQGHIYMGWDHGCHMDMGALPYGGRSWWMLTFLCVTAGRLAMISVLGLWAGEYASGGANPFQVRPRAPAWSDGVVKVAVAVAQSRIRVLFFTVSLMASSIG